MIYKEVYLRQHYFAQVWIHKISNQINQLKIFPSHLLPSMYKKGIDRLFTSLEGCVWNADVSKDEGSSQIMKSISQNNNAGRNNMNNNFKLSAEDQSFYSNWMLT